MIRIIGYCEKCKTSIKVIDGKQVCGCARKKLLDRIIKKEIPGFVFNCERCGEQDVSEKKRKRKRRLCKKCTKLRQKEQMQAWYLSHYVPK